MKPQKVFFNAMLHDVSHSTAETAKIAEFLKRAACMRMSFFHNSVTLSPSKWDYEVTTLSYCHTAWGLWEQEREKFCKKNERKNFRQDQHY